jgi:hypothetical protein
MFALACHEMALAQMQAEMKQQVLGPKTPAFQLSEGEFLGALEKSTHIAAELAGVGQASVQFDQDPLRRAQLKLIIGVMRSQPLGIDEKHLKSIREENLDGTMKALRAQEHIKVAVGTLEEVIIEGSGSMRAL